MLQYDPNFWGQPLNEGFVTTIWTTWKGDHFFFLKGGCDVKPTI